MEHIFPIIKSHEPKRIYIEIEQEGDHFNQALKKIAKIVKIDSKITSYVPRHSFASLAKTKGYSFGCNLRNAWTQIYQDNSNLLRLTFRSKKRPAAQPNN